MQNRPSRERRSERGMTLAEALVAVLIFSIVFLAALGLYQSANRAYAATDAATIQQQNMRFAMDRISDSVRGAGASYNVTGNTSIPDEQIEGAWEAAIFVRGDYDNARETALENATHPVVTTGNDEIVGYVLRKPGGNANNPVGITINADLTPSTGRDATISGGTITNEETSGTVYVATTTLAGETNPPYELTKVTFDSSGNPVYEVVAENVFRMSFSYLDSTGASAITTFGSADAQRSERASVRQIDINLIGMSDRPDFGYVDSNTYTPAEGTATKNRHKFALAEHLVPPNLGKMGRRHSAAPAITIAAPVSITACVGHCRYYHISWPATTTPGITTYMLHIVAAAGADPVAAPAVDVNTNVTGLSYDYMQPDADTTRPFTFSVAGVYGVNPGTFSPVVSATSSNQLPASTPAAPTTVAGAQGTGNTIDLAWTPTTTNTGTLSGMVCTTAGVGSGSSAATAPWTTAAPDIGYYKVFRVRNAAGNTASFTTTAANRVDDKSIGPLQNIRPDTTATFTDRLAAPCTAYFYKVQACDLCDVASADSAGSASTSFDLTDPAVTPAAPATLNGTTTSSGGNFNVTLNWSAVTQTTGSAPAATAHYIINREQKLGSGIFLPNGRLDAYIEPGQPTTQTDSVPTQVSGQPATYRYTVNAAYDCLNPRISAASPAYVASCVPSGTLSVTTPATGTDYPRPYSTSVVPALNVTGTGWTSATVTITDASGALKYSQTLSGAGPTYTFPTWNVSDTNANPDGTYTLTATGTAGACTTNPVTTTFTLSTTTCSLNIASPVYQGNGANAYTSLDFRIQNTCTSTNLTFNQMKFTWSGVLAARYISQVKYNGVAITSALTSATGGNGVVINLTTPQTINANTTSAAVFTLVFSSNFTSDGSKNGTPGKFPSIIVHETSPVSANDELVVGNPIP